MPDLPTTRDELIEIMMRATWKQRHGGVLPMKGSVARESMEAEINASLDALEAAHCRVVPEEATGEMQQAMYDELLRQQIALDEHSDEVGLLLLGNAALLAGDIGRK